MGTAGRDICLHAIIHRDDRPEGLINTTALAEGLSVADRDGWLYAATQTSPVAHMKEHPLDQWFAPDHAALLIWRPRDDIPDGTAPLSVRLQIDAKIRANSFALDVAASALQRFPKPAVTFDPIPITLQDTTDRTAHATVQIAPTKGLTASLRVWIETQRPVGETLPLPQRLVGYAGEQTLQVIGFQIDHDDDGKGALTIWPTLRDFVSASLSLPPYAWIYLPPSLAPMQTANGWVYVQEPILVHRGAILRFVAPAAGKSAPASQPTP